MLGHLSHDELRQVYYYARREQAQRSFYHFVKQSWKHVVKTSEYQDNWHIGCICEHLQAVSMRQIRNIIINCPPRHSKSVISCVFWPAWEWTRKPESKFLCSSYSESLVMRDAKYARELMETEWYRKRWGEFEIGYNHKSSLWYDNTRGGYRISTTVGGRGLGHGADFIVVDDPMKALDAKYKTVREHVIEWWTRTMSSRGDDPRTVCKVVIMQRLHENDLSGYLIQNELGYEHLVLPEWHESSRVYHAPPTPRPKDAIVWTSVQRDRPELRDPRKEDGELMWPDRFGREQVEQSKKELLDAWPGQLQQRPSNQKGEIFESSLFRYCQIVQTAIGQAFQLTRPDGIKTVPVRDCRFFQTFDTAQKTKTTNDYFVCVTFALTPDIELIVFHVSRTRVEIPYQMRFIKGCRQGPTQYLKEERKVLTTGFWPRQIVGQWVEEASSGVDLIANARAAGIVLRTLRAGRNDKVSRSATVASLYENGAVYHMTGARWLVEFEEELRAFPKGTHDDQVDALSYGGALAVHSMILRSGIGDIEKMAEEYKKENSDRGENYHPKPFQLAPDEVEDEGEESPPVVVSVGDADLEIVESHDHPKPNDEVSPPDATEIEELWDMLETKEIQHEWSESPAASPDAQEMVF